MFVYEIFFCEMFVKLEDEILRVSREIHTHSDLII